MPGWYENIISRYIGKPSPNQLFFLKTRPETRLAETIFEEYNLKNAFAIFEPHFNADHAYISVDLAVESTGILR